MPQMYFDVRFPDGQQERCYSPSLVVRELLREHTEYPSYEFMARVRAALTIASARVHAKYGFTCSAAMDQLASLEARARAWDEGDLVRVLAFYDAES